VIIAKLQKKQNNAPHSNTIQDEINLCAMELDMRISANKELMNEDVTHERKVLEEIKREGKLYK